MAAEGEGAGEAEREGEREGGGEGAARAARGWIPPALARSRPPSFSPSPLPPRPTPPTTPGAGTAGTWRRALSFSDRLCRLRPEP